MQEVNNFLQGFLGFILSGHVLEGNAGLLLHVDPGLGLAEAAHHAVAAHPLGQQIQQQKHAADHNGVGQHHHNDGIVLHDLVADLHARIVQFLRQCQHIAAAGNAGEAGSLLGQLLGRLFLGHIHDPVIPQLHLGKLPGILCGKEIRQCGLRILTFFHCVHDPAEQQHQNQRDHQRGKIASLWVVSSGLFPIIGVVSPIWLHICSPPYFVTSYHNFSP